MKVKIFELIYLGILIGIITISIILFIFMNALVGFVLSLIGLTFAIFDNILKPYRKEFEEKIKEQKKVKYLFALFQELLEYLESKQYWDNNERNDEKINTKILSFTDNIEELRKYFGYNIINEERGQFNKKITLLEGRFIITFKNHTPYDCYINKKGRVNGPFKLYEENTSASEIKNLMHNEIKTNLKDKYNLEI